MPNTASAILLIVVFLMPGFIYNRFLAFAYPDAEASETRAVLTAITFSFFNYAVLSPLLILFWKKTLYQNLGFLAGASFFVLFLSPILMAWLVVRAVESSWARSWRRALGLMHPMPKAWDYFFHLGRPCWVVAILKNGRTFAGYYGGNSFASSFPAEEDLYLEALCTLTPEGRIVGVAQGSVGGIIRTESVDTLEFFESDPRSGSTSEDRHG